MKATATGRAPADQTRAHVEVLISAGVSISVIVRLSGVPRSTVEWIRQGAATVSTGHAGALLALDVQRCEDADEWVPAAPVREALRTILASAGLTAYQLRKHVGIDANSMHRVLDPDTTRVSKTTANRIMGVDVATFRSTALERVDAGPTADHLDTLVDAGATYRQIAARAGVHATTIARIHRGRSLLIDADTAAWITGVALVTIDDLKVDAGPVRDHLAVLRAHVPRRQVALLAGCAPSALQRIEAGSSHTTQSLARRVLAISVDDTRVVNPWADLDQVTRHVQTLRAGRIPLRTIAAHAEVTPALLSKVLRGDSRRMTAAVGQRILAVRPHTITLLGGVRVPATGTRRRIQALACQGWSSVYVAQRLGVSGISLTRQEQVSKATADKIAALYEELKYLQGPSEQAAATARARGWVPVTVWEGVNIDTDSDPCDVAA